MCNIEGLQTKALKLTHLSKYQPSPSTPLKCLTQQPWRQVLWHPACHMSQPMAQCSTGGTLEERIFICQGTRHEHMPQAAILYSNTLKLWCHNFSQNLVTVPTSASKSEQLSQVPAPWNASQKSLMLCGRPSNSPFGRRCRWTWVP